MTRGAPRNPAYSRCLRYSCTAGVHGPIGRSSSSPRRFSPVVMRPAGRSVISEIWWALFDAAEDRFEAVEVVAGHELALVPPGGAGLGQRLDQGTRRGRVADATDDDVVRRVLV